MEEYVEADGLGTLVADGGSLLLVTHDRNLAARMDRCLELHMGCLREPA